MHLRAVLVLFSTALLAESVGKPDAGLVGAPRINPLSDCCWNNVTLNATGKRALIITTSYGEKLPGGKMTGVPIEEFAAPYYVYLEADMEVDIASIKGGAVPVGDSTPTYSQIRYKLDHILQSKMSNTSRIDDVNFSEYDVVFMAGGWGAAFDLGYSQVLGAKVAGALAAHKPMVGSTCHGALGFTLANKTGGTPWLRGMTVTGVTVAQIEWLGIDNETPMHPEIVLKEKGANYLSIHGQWPLGDAGATSVAVDSKGPVVVTGQNQNSACVVAQRQLLFLMASAGTNEDTYAWVPDEHCHAPVKVCYQGFKADVEHCAQLDPLNLCKYGGHAAIKVGTCAAFGFGAHFKIPLGTLTKDPIFRKTTIWKETWPTVV